MRLRDKQEWFCCLPEKEKKGIVGEREKEGAYAYKSETQDEGSHLPYLGASRDIIKFKYHSRLCSNNAFDTNPACLIVIDFSSLLVGCVDYIVFMRGESKISIYVDITLQTLCPKYDPLIPAGILSLVILTGKGLHHGSVTHTAAFIAHRHRTDTRQHRKKTSDAKQKHEYNEDSGLFEESFALSHVHLSASTLSCMNISEMWLTRPSLPHLCCNTSICYILCECMSPIALKLYIKQVLWISQSVLIHHDSCPSTSSWSMKKASVSDHTGRQHVA